jgi:predicted choloylglycine hydrolase
MPSRPLTQEGLHMLRLALAACLFLAADSAVAPARAQTPFRFPAAKNGQAELKYVNNVPLLVVAGTPQEIGESIGALALKPGKRILEYPRDLLDQHGIKKLWGLFLGSGKGMFRNFPPEYRDELESMVRSSGADRDLVIAGNTFFDIKKTLACSALLVDRDRSNTGGTLFGRNLDYPSLGYIHHYSLVTVYRPKKGLAFASVGFPGLVGVLSGMNEAGLVLGVLEVFDIKSGEPHFDAHGIPYGLCLRRVLEQARTIDEAKKVLEGLRRTTIINLAIADKTDVAVLEISPKRVVKRRGARGVCVTTNHFCTRELKADSPVDVSDSLARFATLEKVRDQDGKVDIQTIHRQLDKTNLGTLTLQTMCFEPAALRLHLSIGKVPASRHKMQVVDLADLLRPATPRKEGSRR